MNIFKYLNIFDPNIYSDIHLYQNFDTNIFEYSFVSKNFIRIYSDIRSCQKCSYEYIWIFVRIKIHTNVTLWSVQHLLRLHMVGHLGDHPHAHRLADQGQRHRQIGQRRPQADLVSPVVTIQLLPEALCHQMAAAASQCKLFLPHVNCLRLHQLPN